MSERSGIWLALSAVCADSGRRKHFGTYRQNWQDLRIGWYIGFVGISFLLLLMVLFIVVFVIVMIGSWQNLEARIVGFRS